MARGPRCTGVNRVSLSSVKGKQGFFGPAFSLITPNESRFRDVYRFFSISPPPAILGDLHFHVISGKIGSADFPLFAFL